MKYFHNCVGLLVDDVDEAANYYAKVLGYGINRKEDSFVEFSTGGPLTFFVWQWDHLVRHLGKEAMSHVKHRVQSAIYFDVPELVDEQYEVLKAQGVHFITEPQDWEWNARAAYFVDDDGYMWELYSWRRGG